MCLRVVHAVLRYNAVLLSCFVYMLYSLARFEFSPMSAIGLELQAFRTGRIRWLGPDGGGRGESLVKALGSLALHLTHTRTGFTVFIRLRPR